MAFLSFDEAAQKLGITADALRALVRERKLRTLNDGGKTFFKDEEVATYLQKNPPTTVSPVIPTDDLVLDLGDDSFDLAGSDQPLLIDEPLLIDQPLLIDEPLLLDGDLTLSQGNEDFEFNLPDDIDLAPTNDGESTMLLKPGSPGNNLRPDPDSGSSDVRGVVPTDDSSSDFDLAPDGGSDSEFTLGSDAINIVSGEDSASGTGLNLDDGSSGTFMLDESSSIFELDGSESLGGGSGSDFEINLEDGSGQLEGGELALDAELADDGSGSVVLPMDDLDGDVDFGDLVEDDGLVVALDGENGDVNAETVAAPSRGRRVNLIKENLDVIDGEDALIDDDVAPSRGRPEAPGAAPVAQPWGALPALVLLPTVVGLVLITLMSFEILNSVIGFFNGTKTSSLILKPMMEMVDPASAKLLN